MKIFDVSNKAKQGFWCAAPDELTAREIALKAKHAKALENLSARDVTAGFVERRDQYGHTGIDEILNGTKTGRVLGRMQSYTMQQILAGVPKIPMNWEVRGA